MDEKIQDLLSMQLNAETLNFHTCKYRSPEKVAKKIKRCSCKGGDYEKSEYLCLERNIYELRPEICKDCPVYESK